MKALGHLQSPGRLEFIEIYQDAAISAAYAVREIGNRLAKEAESLGCRIEAALTLESDKGMSPRLAAAAGANYWSRLIVTDADRREDRCPPECREDFHPQPRLNDLGPPKCLDPTQQAEAQKNRLPTHPERRPELAQRLRFVFLSQRARAETVEQQRQPGLVETLVERSIRNPIYQPDLSRTLFHLMVPHDFKEAARQAENLVLVVDGYTANLPWEMLVADDKPLVLSTPMVRQLASTRFRPQVRGALEKRAYVVGNPSTAGYYTAFPSPKRPDKDELDLLPGAEREARTVADLLMGQGYTVVEAPPGSEAVEVVNKLFKHPYRIVHISAHGAFQVGEGQSLRSGVVLSDGLLLTAAEIGQMEIVPDLVFLSCCFLGKTDNSPAAAYNRLAYSVARELIEIGVRAVVVAGWAVRDDAAQIFSETFYQSLLREQLPFGKAIHQARCKTYESFSDCNTWGAFQAYGDPSFVIDPGGRAGRDHDDSNPVAPQELVARINALKNDAEHNRGDAPRLRKQLKTLLQGSSRAWANLPEVLCALGRFYGELGDFDDAIKNYRAAIAIEDKKGLAPVTAIEQLANFEARQGTAEFVRQGIKRLLGLFNAAGGAADDLINSERCAMLGSAYKRLAKVIIETPAWDDVRKALEQAVKWYAKGESVPSRSDFSPYCAQNRLAVMAALGKGDQSDAALALQAGEIARQRYAASRDYFDLIMAADGVLIARIIDGSLRDRPDDDEREILGCYRDIREQQPESARQLDSVITQIELLAKFIEKRPAVDQEIEQIGTLAERLRRIAGFLKGDSDAAVGKRPESPDPSSPSSISGESRGAGLDADARPDLSADAGDDSSEQPDSKHQGEQNQG